MSPFFTKNNFLPFFNDLNCRLITQPHQMKSNTCVQFPKEMLATIFLSFTKEFSKQKCTKVIPSSQWRVELIKNQNTMVPIWRRLQSQPITKPSRNTESSRSSQNCLGFLGPNLEYPGVSMYISPATNLYSPEAVMIVATETLSQFLNQECMFLRPTTLFFKKDTSLFYYKSWLCKK